MGFISSTGMEARALVVQTLAGLCFDQLLCSQRLTHTLAPVLREDSLAEKIETKESVVLLSGGCCHSSPSSLHNNLKGRTNTAEKRTHFDLLNSWWCSHGRRIHNSPRNQTVHLETWGQKIGILKLDFTDPTVHRSAPGNMTSRIKSQQRPFSSGFEQVL